MHMDSTSRDISYENYHRWPQPSLTWIQLLHLPFHSWFVRHNLFFPHERMNHLFLIVTVWNWNQSGFESRRPWHDVYPSMADLANRTRRCSDATLLEFYTVSMIIFWRFSVVLKAFFNNHFYSGSSNVGCSFIYLNQLWKL